MIRVGEKVSFIPGWAISKVDDEAEKLEKTVSGRVIYVNQNHQMFCVKYRCGGTMQKETFKLSQIGADDGAQLRRIRGGEHGR